jgi:hypothetical protein
MRTGNNAAIVAPILGRAGDPPKPRTSDFNDQAIFIALAAGPPCFPAQVTRGAVDRRHFASIFVKTLM